MISTEIMNFLRDWLSKHIMQTDKKFGQALNKAGVK
jgi:hemerythrin